jgi:hypothetical protein
MDKQKFSTYLKNQTYTTDGKINNYTTKAINKRVTSLTKVEALFNIDLDSIINDKSEVIKLLCSIRKKGYENPNHTPLSNAVRHYYACQTGDKIERIF